MRGKVRRLRAKDSAYSWVILLMATVSNIITGGFITAPALLLIEWYSVFDKSTAMVAWIPAVAVLTKSVSSLFAGGLIDSFGCRATSIVSSILAALFLIACSFTSNFQLLVVGFAFFGFFHGIMSPVPIVIIYEYFDKYKSLASGLSMCGLSLSSMLMVPLFRYCIDEYGWRGSVLIMAGVALNNCVCGAVFAPNTPLESDENEKGGKAAKNGGNMSKMMASARKVFSCAGLCNMEFIIIVIAYCMVFCHLCILLLLSPSRAVSKGLTNMQASMLLPCLGFSSTVSRLIVSPVSNLQCTSHIGIFTSGLFLLSVLLSLSCLVADDFLLSAVMMNLCGLVIGGPLTVFPATLVDMMGMEGLGRGYGIANAAAGPVTTLILPTAGFIYDMTGDFNNAFHLGAGLGFLAACLTMVIVVKHCRKAPQDPESQDHDDLQRHCGAELQDCDDSKSPEPDQEPLNIEDQKC